MSRRYLLDTNICIYLLSQLDSPVWERVDAARAESIAVSAVTSAELAIGAGRFSDRELRRAQEILASIEVLPFDLDAARIYGRLPFKRGSYDRLIAAHALSLELILVTNNEADFAGLPGLRIENWTRST